MAKNLNFRTEDQVRDSAKIILGFDEIESQTADKGKSAVVFLQKWVKNRHKYGIIEA